MNYPWDFHRHIKSTDALKEILEKERQAKRPALLCSAGLKDWDVLVETSKKASQHKIALGIHPWSTANKTLKELELEFESLKQLIQKNQNFQIGETGLDTLKGADLDLQKFLFSKHLDLAFKENRLCVIHCVRAYSELLGILNKLNQQKKMPRCMVHYYSSSPEIAQKLNDLGVALSFNVSKTKANSEFNEKLKGAIKNCETPLFESDEEGPEEAEKVWESFDGHFPRKIGALEWTVKAQAFWNSL